MTEQWQTATVIGGGLAGCEAAWQLAQRLALLLQLLRA